MRGLSRPGSKNPAAKLTDADVVEMRRLYRESRITYAELGVRFGMSTSAVQSAVTGVSWANV